MNKYEIHTALMREVVYGEEDDETLLLWMVLLHTHSIQLHPGVVLEDVTSPTDGKGILLPAITRRHVARVMASLWQAGDPRSEVDYWFSRYETLMPFEVLGDVPMQYRDRIEQLRLSLLGDPRVLTVVPED